MRRISLNPAYLLRKLRHRRPSRYFTYQCNELHATFIDHLVRQKECSFTLLLVHRIIPKAIEFFLDHPADIPRA